MRIDGEVKQVDKSLEIHPNFQPKRLKVAKFDDNELEVICDKQFAAERKDWMVILADKFEKDPHYIETVSKPNLTNDFHKTA